MKTMTAKDLKNKTGEVIKTIKQGEEILISYRGKPLAKFMPLRKTSILGELSGIIRGAPKDMRRIRDERLGKKYEGVY